MRYIFETLRCVQICTVSDALPALQRPAASTICKTWPVWYRVQTGAACPASWRVCLCAVCCGHGLPCIWHGLRCCLFCAVPPGVLGLWSPPEGYARSAGGGVGHARDKIFQRKRRFRRSSYQHPPLLHKTTPIRLCKSPKIPKNTKRPLSEPRLCYNQLKATSQRKGESK